MKIAIKNKEFSLSFVLSILSSAFGVLFSFLAAKYLEAELYGQIQYYISIASLLNAISIFGIDNFIIKNYQFSEDKKTFISNAYIFSAIISIITLPFYFVVGYFLLNKLQKDILVILIIYLASVLLTMSNIACAFFQAKNKYELRVLFSSFLPHLLLLLVLLLHLIVIGINNFVSLYLYYYLLAYGLIGLVMVFRLFRFQRFSFRKNEIISIVIFGATWILYNITTPISNIIIGEKYEDFGVSGIFALSSQLLTVAAIATSIIGNMSYTVYAKFVKENENEKLFEYFQMFTRIVMYIAIPFYSAFIIESHQLMLFFGESYLGHDLIVILLSVNAMIECITGPCGSVLLMGGKEKENCIASIARFVVFLLTLFVLIRYTIYAAPIALISSSIVTNIIKLIYLKKFQKRNYFTLNIVLTFICTTAISMGLFFPLRYVNNTILWVALNCIVGVGLILGFILLTPFKKDKLFFIKNKGSVE